MGLYLFSFFMTLSSSPFSILLVGRVKLNSVYERKHGIKKLVLLKWYVLA